MPNPIQSTRVPDKIYTIVDFLQKGGVFLPEINTANPSLEDIATACYYLNEYCAAKNENLNESRPTDQSNVL